MKYHIQRILRHCWGNGGAEAANSVGMNVMCRVTVAGYIVCALHLHDYD